MPMMQTAEWTLELYGRNLLLKRRSRTDVQRNRTIVPLLLDPIHPGHHNGRRHVHHQRRRTQSHEVSRQRHQVAFRRAKLII